MDVIMLSAFTDFPSCLIEFESLVLNTFINFYLFRSFAAIDLCCAAQYGAEEPEPSWNMLLSTWANTEPYIEKQGLLAGLCILGRGQGCLDLKQAYLESLYRFLQAFVALLTSQGSAVNPDVLSPHPVAFPVPVLNLVHRWMCDLLHSTCRDFVQIRTLQCCSLSLCSKGQCRFGLD